MCGVMTTTGVEMEGCFSTYYYNHLYNQTQNYIFCCLNRKEREQMLIPNRVDRHFPVFHMNILSF